MIDHFIEEFESDVFDNAILFDTKMDEFIETQLENLGQKGFKGKYGFDGSVF